MAVLGLIYWLFAIVIFIAQYLLYRSHAKRSIYTINLVIALILAFIVFTSFPSNYLLQKGIAVVLALIAIGAFYLERFNTKDILAKLLLTLSLLGNFLLLII